MNRITQITASLSECTNQEIDFLFNFVSTMRHQRMVNGHQTMFASSLVQGAPSIPRPIATPSPPPTGSWGDSPPPSEDLDTIHQDPKSSWTKTSVADIVKAQTVEFENEKVVREEEEQRVNTLPSYVTSFCGDKDCGCFYSCKNDEDPCRQDHDLIDQTQIFIGNLPTDLHFDTIRYGLSNELGTDLPIKRTFIKYDREKEKGLGHGFMTFFCHQDAVKAAGLLNGREFFLKKLYVNFSQRSSRSRNGSEESSEESIKAKPRKYRNKK